MARPGTVAISVVADTSKASAAFRKTADELNKFKGSATQAQVPLSGMSSKLGVLAGGLAAGAVVKAFKSAISETVAWGTQVKSLTRNLGVTAEQASGLAAAAHHFGLETDDLNRGLGIFEKHLVAGDKAIQKAGIHFHDAQGNVRPFNQILGETADIFKKMPDGPEKTALALNLFGRSGKQLIPLLNQGAEGLKHFDEEAKKLGLSLSGSQLAAISKYKFAQRDLSATIEGLQVQLGLKVIPALTGFVHVLTQVTQAISHVPTGVLTAIGVFGAFVASVLLVKRVTEATQVALGFLKARYEALAGAIAGETAAQQAQTAVTVENAAATRTAAASLLTLEGGQISATAGADALTAALALQGTATAGIGGRLRGLLGPLSAVKGGVTGLIGTLGVYGGVIYATIKATDFFARKIDETLRGLPHPEALASALGALSAGGQDVDRVFAAARINVRAFSKELDDAHHNVVAFGAFGRILEKVVPSGFKAAKHDLEDLDKALADMVKGGNASGAARAFALINKQLKLTPTDTVHFLHDYTEALKASAGPAEAAADALDQFQFNLEATKQATEDFNALLVKGAPKEFIDSLRSMGDQGVTIAEALLSGSKEQLDKFVALWQQGLGEAGKAVAVFADMTRDDFNKWKAGSVAAFNGVSSALDEFVGKAKVSPKQILKAFDEQLKAQREYEKNWRALLGRGIPQQFAKQLQDMGIKGAGIVAALAHANATQFAHIIADWIKAGGVATHTANDIDAIANSVAGINSTQLKVLNDQFDKIKLRGDIRTVIETVVKERGLNVKVLKQFLDGLGVKGTLRTQILASVTAAVRARVTSVTGTAHFTTSISGGHGDLKFYEHGGRVRKGIGVIVGEKRPELFVPDQDGYIFPRVPTPIQTTAAEAAAAAPILSATQSAPALAPRTPPAPLTQNRGIFPGASPIAQGIAQFVSRSSVTPSAAAAIFPRIQVVTSTLTRSAPQLSPAVSPRVPSVSQVASTLTPSSSATSTAPALFSRVPSIIEATQTLAPRPATQPPSALFPRVLSSSEATVAVTPALRAVTQTVGALFSRVPSVRQVAATVAPRLAGSATTTVARSQAPWRIDYDQLAAKLTAALENHVRAAKNDTIHIEYPPSGVLSHDLPAALRRKQMLLGI